METGNVHSKSGAVRVRGSVRSGFKVEAPGDIIVDEVVEEADIVSGGSVVVSGGVIMNRKNRIVAKNDVTAKFFQNALIAAGGDVTAEAELSHCDVKAGGRVAVLGSSGMISGGRVESAGGVQAEYLGNEARSKTSITLRIMGPKEEKVLEGRNLLIEELTRLDRAIGAEDALQSLMNAPEEDRRILAELIKVRARIQADIRSIDEELAEERREMEARLAQTQVKVGRTAYSGVVIVIGSRRLALTEDMDAPVFQWDAAGRSVAVG